MHNKVYNINIKFFNNMRNLHLQTDADSRDKTIRYMTKHMGRFLLEMARNRLLENKVKS